MSEKRMSRNAPCPCGSGKKYKKCCYDKKFDWLEDEDGNIVRSVPISPDLADLLAEQKAQWVEEHGREPGPDDLLFPDLPHLEVVEHELVEAMKEAGLDPALIYAFEKTGLIVSEENMNLIPEKDLEEWGAAVEEYRAQHADPQLPIGTVMHYGPDDETTTKIVAGVVVDLESEPTELRRWVGTNIVESEKVQRELQAFFDEHGVKSIAIGEGIMGCPHEEGLDFPEGDDCPFCPFWKGKQGTGRYF